MIIVTILVFAPCVAAEFALAFFIARISQPASVAARIAAVFVAGSGAGCLATAVCAGLLGDGTLHETWQVIALSSGLVAGALLGGAVLVALCIKCKVLSLRAMR